MNRRDVLRLIGMSALGTLVPLTVSAKPVHQGVKGCVIVDTVSPSNELPQTAIYACYQQSINDFARDAIRRFPTAYKIHLILSSEIETQWELKNGVWINLSGLPSLKL